MPDHRLPQLHRAPRALAALVCSLLLCGGLHAAGLTVLLADDSAAHAEFARSVRTGGAADTALAAPDASLTIAIGAEAAQAAIDAPGQGPLVLACLSRLDYENLKTSAALRHPERAIGVLLREPALADQLALIDTILPRKRRLGVVATTESEPVIEELQRAARGWDLQIEYAPDARSLAAALRRLVSRSDALLVLPDIGDNQAATLAVLRAGASAGLPVFGASDGMVRSGGLAAAVATPEQLAGQALLLGRKLGNNGGAPVVLIEQAAPATVRVNTTVAHALGLKLPDAQELSARITALR